MIPRPQLSEREIENFKMKCGRDPPTLSLAFSEDFWMDLDSVGCKCQNAVTTAVKLCSRPQRRWNTDIISLDAWKKSQGGSL